MHFVSQQVNSGNAKATAERIVQLLPEALAGLSLEELSQIQNFDVPSDGISSIEALPVLDGSVTGTIFEFDGTTPVPGSEVGF